MGKVKDRGVNRESLAISDLGPIGRFAIEPRRLTVIAGEQATGKSLLAQLLYLFRGLRDHLTGSFQPGITRQKGWKAEMLRGLLDDLRGVSFGYFANGTAEIAYRGADRDSKWTVKVYEANRRVGTGRVLGREMAGWVEEWERHPGKLRPTGRPQVFIPTERSLFTRFIQKQPKILFSDFQPLPVREFANSLQAALDRYAEAPSNQTLRKLQRRALRGAAFVPKRGRRDWKWKTGNGGRAKILPIEAVASGQMEAWPFFAVAEANLDRGIAADYYLEEPETHLHPVAQVAVMDAIALLIARGSRVVMTTHSPYLLYRLNNLLQRAMNRDAGATAKAGRDAPLAIPAEAVSAYRLGEQPGAIFDRRSTGLIDTEELERVADELGGEFDALLAEEHLR